MFTQTITLDVSNHVQVLFTYRVTFCFSTDWVKNLSY